MKANVRIGIDARPLQPPWAGIARYQVEICREIAQFLPEAEFYLYTHRPIDRPVDSPRWRVRQDPWAFASKLKNVVWVKLRLGQLCRSDNLNLFWSPDPFLPHLPPEVPTVATVHDVNGIVAPNTMHWAHRWADRLFFERDLRRATAIVSVSKGTESRLKEHTGISATEVIPPAVHSQFRCPEPGVLQRVVKEKYKLERPYLLTVATWEPRKNLDLVLDAFESLRGQAAFHTLELALVGGRGWRDQPLAQRIERLQSVGLRMLGYVPEADLPSLYAGCACFVFPSRYEGFGSPVIEARACGAAVVTTDIPELHESGGASAIYVQPTLDGVVGGIKRALIGNMTRPDRDGLPSWSTSARRLAELFESLMSVRTGPAQRQLSERTQPNWESTVP